VDLSPPSRLCLQQEGPQRLKLRNMDGVTRFKSDEPAITIPIAGGFTGGSGFPPCGDASGLICTLFDIGAEFFFAFSL